MTEEQEEPQRFCVFCDRAVQPMMKSKAIIGHGSDEDRFIHRPAAGTCGRANLDGTETYVMGLADTGDRE